MTTRPNILFIIMDDQRPDTLGKESAFPCKTPHLDQLCESGTTFNRHYVTTPICTPGRAEVLTGHHSYHNDVRWFGQPIKKSLPLLPEILQDSGYHTIHVGKWHNDGHPKDKGYDRVRRAMHDSSLPYREFGHEMEWLESGKPMRGHSTEMFSEAAIEEIKHSPEERPWFCYLAFHSPHDPFQAPKEFLPESGDIPKNFMPVYPYDNGDMTIRDELLLPFPRTPDKVREYRRQYTGMIQHHDNHLGNVLSYLKDTNQTENTLIVFTSDHGLAVGDHGLLGKENMHEHSCRVPCIMSGPGTEAGKQSSQLTHHTDFLPTLMEAANLDHPPSDGQSLFAEPKRDFLCSGFTSPAPNPDDPLRETQRMIVTDRYKYIWYPVSGHEAIYDLKEDPHETVNILNSWNFTEYPLYGYKPNHKKEEINFLHDDLKIKLKNWGLENNDPLFS